jgi:hypothetical protein
MIILGGRKILPPNFLKKNNYANFLIAATKKIDIELIRYIIHGLATEGINWWIAR